MLLRRPTSLLLLCSIIAGISACASIRPLDVGERPIALKDDEGILLVHIDTDWRLGSITAANVGVDKVATDVEPGEHIIFVIAKAGSYRWSRLTGLDSNEYVYFDLNDSRKVFGFTVEAGKLNYPGLLSIKSAGSRGQYLATIRSINRSVMLFNSLKKSHRPLLETFPIHYAGRGSDRVFDLIVNETRRRWISADEKAGK
jgi:hypothetical protein